MSTETKRKSSTEKSKRNSEVGRGIEALVSDAKRSQTVKSSSDKYEEKYKKLVDDYNSLKEQYEVLEGELGETNETLEKYEDKVKELLLEHNKLMDKVQELENESVEWEKSYDKLIDENVLLKQQLDETQAEKSPKRASSTNSRLEEKLKKLQSENELLKEELNELNKENKKLLQDNDFLKEQIESMRVELLRHEKAPKTISTRLDDKYKKLLNENISLKKKIEGLEKELKTTDTKTIIHKELDQLTEDNELLRQKLTLQEEDFRLENKTLMQKLNALMKSNENYEMEINNFRKELNSYDDKRIINQSNELDTLRAQNLSLQTTLENTIHDNEYDLETLNQISLETKKNLKEENLRMHVLIENLRKKLAEKKESLTKLKAGKNNLIQFNEIQLDALKATLNADLEKLNTQINQLNEEKRRLNEKCDNLEEHIQILESTISCLSNEKMNELNGVVEKYEAKMQALNKEIEELNKIKVRLSTQLDDSQKSYLNSLTASQKFENEIQDLKEKFKQITQQSESRLKTLNEIESKFSIERLSHANDIKSLRNIIEEKQNALKLKDIEIAESRLKLNNELQIERSKQANEIVNFKKIIDEKQADLKSKEVELADTRQRIIDEYEAKIKIERASYANELKTLKKIHEEKSTSYEARISELERNIDKLSQLAEKCKENEEKLKSFDELKRRYEKELKNHESQLSLKRAEYEKNLREKILDYEEKFIELDKCFNSDREQMEKEFTKERDAYDSKLNDLINKYNDLKKSYEKLNGEYKCELESKIVMEKKHLTAIKDMKRQLQLAKNCSY